MSKKYNIYICSVEDEKSYVVADDRDSARQYMAYECKVNFTKVHCKVVKKNVSSDFAGVISEADAHYEYNMPSLYSYEED